MQRKLLKDLLTKIPFYDFPQTDLTEVPSVAMNLGLGQNLAYSVAYLWLTFYSVNIPL